MKQYSDKDFTFSDPAVNNVIVFILKPKELNVNSTVNYNRFINF